MDTYKEFHLAVIKQQLRVVDNYAILLCLQSIIELLGRSILSYLE